MEKEIDLNKDLGRITETEESKTETELIGSRRSVEIRLTKDETLRLMELWDNWAYCGNNKCESKEEFHKLHLNYVTVLGAIKSSYGYETWSVYRVDFENGIMVLFE